MPRQVIDLTGQTFGRLTVKARVYPDKEKLREWALKLGVPNEYRRDRP